VNNQPKPAQIVIMVSGAVALISAFLPWWKVPSGFGGDDSNAFDKGLFPFATYIILIGIAMGVLAGLSAFANVNLPERVLGFTWTQVNLVLAVFAGLLAIGFLIQDSFGLDKGIGLWLGFLASAGLVTGAVMEHMQSDEVSSGAPSAPPTPF
jgi:hypothetical protein